MRAGIKKHSLLRSRLVLLLGVLFFLVCADGTVISFPASCGDDDLDPIILSNIIDYTYPPSGMILKAQDFDVLRIHFLNRVSEMSVPELNGAVKVYRIENFWDSNEEIPPVETAIPSLDWFFRVGDIDWKSLGDPTPGFADYLYLPIFSDSEYIQPAKHYRIQILKACEENDTEPCSENPLTDFSGYAHDTNVNIFIGIVGDEIHPCPFIRNNLEDELNSRYRHLDGVEGVNKLYIPPHYHLSVEFSKQMGFVNFDAVPLWGLYFSNGSGTDTVNGQDVLFSTLESDSKQGLTPGDTYSLLIKSSDTVPDEMMMGIPFTMDRYGNPLVESDGLAEPKTITFIDGHEASHAQIIFPFHVSFSDKPDPWHENLVVNGEAQDHYIMVNVKEDVKVLRSMDPLELAQGIEPSEQNSDVYFERVLPPEVRYGIQAFRIDNITILRGSKGYPSTINVHAYDSTGAGANWLGEDTLEVLAHPPPTEDIMVVTYNAYTDRPYEASTWQERFQDFADFVVVRHRPGIIAMQEILTTGHYLDYLLDTIHEALREHGIRDGRYYVANTIGPENGQGLAILYDSDQVKYVPTQWRGSGDPPIGCRERHVNQGEHYEFGYWENSDCFVYGDEPDHAVAGRAIFEFPRGSGKYFNLHNTHIRLHGAICSEFFANISFMWERHESFASELEELGEEVMGIYPPILAGDTNYHTREECSEETIEAIEGIVELDFYTGGGPWHIIDIVWIGKESIWDTVTKYRPPTRTTPCQPENGDVWPFVCRGNYLYAVPTVAGFSYNPFRDHSPSMVELHAGDGE